MKFQSSKMFLFLVALLMFAASDAVCQYQSRLEGVVTDPGDARVPGAQVLVTNEKTGVPYSTQSNEIGNYSFPSLPPGVYTLTAEIQGFKKFARGNVLLETGLARSVDIRLEFGQVTETVVVDATPPLLESQTSNVGQLVEHSTFANLPISSRRGGGLVRLYGFVSYSAELAAPQLPAFSIAGGRAREQNWMLDGTSVMQVRAILGQIALNPPAESMQELRIEANNYPADVGGNGGGVIQMTSRSGTNEFHGALYEFLRNDKLDARTFFAPAKAPLRFNIFGGSVGGPIIKNKTFYFGNIEIARKRVGVTYNEVVPHSADRVGDFSRRVDITVLDPLTGGAFPGNTIPSSRIDPVARALALYYPLPNQAGIDVTRAPGVNYLANASTVLNQEAYNARVDHNLTNNTRFFFRYMRINNYIADPVRWPEDLRVADPAASVAPQPMTSFVASWTQVVSPTVFNDFRFGHMAVPVHASRLGHDSGVSGKVGLKGVRAEHFPRIDITGVSSIGNSLARDFTQRSSRSFSDSLTWVRGQHQVKAGIEFRSSYSSRAAESSGSFSFSDRATRDGMAAFLLGWTTAASLQDIVLTTHTNYWSAFLMDDWKVARKLTVNLGLRWEMDTPFWRDDNALSGFDATATNPVSETPGVVTFAPFAASGKYAHRFDRNNFGPRIGIAYRPADGWALRAGYGIAYSRPWYFVEGGAALGFNPSASFNSVDGGLTPAFLLAAGLPAPPPNEQLSPGFGAVPVGSAPRVAPEFYPSDHATGYSQHWNLSVQKELPGGTLAELAYVANVGHKLFGGNVPMNTVPLVNGRGPERQDQRLRRFPQYSNVTWQSPAWGNSSYHGVNAKFEKRYADGLNFLMSFTWSKFLDDICGVSEVGGCAGQTHAELRLLDKSFSGNHIGRRFMSSVVYELPWGPRRPINSRALNALAGGWVLGVIGEFRDGAPFAVTEQTSLTNTFGGNRPNLLRDPQKESESRGDMVRQFFDTSAFQAPAVSVIGNAPRSICCGPGLIGLDLSAQKKFQVSERMNLQFRGEFFNFVNRPNFGQPNGARGSSTFGSITSLLGDNVFGAGVGGRAMQLSLRLEF